MAYEALVVEVREVVKRLQQEKGEIALAMLIATSSEADAPWNLVLSAEWMDNKSRAEVIGFVINLLRKHVSKKDWSAILMVSVLNTNDRFVDAINQAFQVTDSTATIQNCEIYGFEVTRGIILESHRPKPVAAAPR